MGLKQSNVYFYRKQLLKNYESHWSVSFEYSYNLQSQSEWKRNS
jgi:hypothetical protein